MNSFIKNSEDILVGPDADITAIGEKVIICPQMDFAHILECGDAHIAETLARAIKTTLLSAGKRVLHIEKTISLSC